MKKDILEIINILFCLIVYYFLLHILGTTCPIKWLTGISCAGCGMSRAILSFLKGDINAAFYYHPLFWLVPILLIVIILRKKISKKIYRGIMFLSLSLFIICYVIRMADPNNNIVICNIKDSIIYRLLIGG